MEGNRYSRGQSGQNEASSEIGGTPEMPVRCHRCGGRTVVVVPRGVVGNERSVVMLSDGVRGVDQDANSRLSARSTSLVRPSSPARSRRAIEPSAR